MTAGLAQGRDDPGRVISGFGPGCCFGVEPNRSGGTSFTWASGDVCARNQKSLYH